MSDDAAIIAVFDPSTEHQIGEIWSRDITYARRLAKRVDARTVWLPARLARDSAVPSGGRKQSGSGQKYGIEGVEAFLKTKSVYTGL
jgi:acyl-CoA reductase-like NAD-dependent aldehyde dehydrogenase